MARFATGEQDAAWIAQSKHRSPKTCGCPSAYWCRFRYTGALPAPTVSGVGGSRLGRCELRPFSILSLILVSANCAATRTAFLIAVALDEPWPTMHMPLIPKRGAPPYSA